MKPQVLSDDLRLGYLADRCGYQKKHEKPESECRSSECVFHQSPRHKSRSDADYGQSVEDAYKKRNEKGVFDSEKEQSYKYNKEV